VGLVLKTVFALHSPWLVGGVMLAMFGTASYEILSRQERRFGGLWGWGVGTATTMLATLFVTGFAMAVLRPMQRSALRSGMIPIINQMSAAGIITLPGMMTGQILAGMAPFEAAKYQILILFLLSGGAGLGALAATFVAVWRVTDERDRLRLDRLDRR
jgi:putative ABC transport system permease protein